MSYNRSGMSRCAFLAALCRRKNVDESDVGQSNLARVLNTFDLTALGVGSTLGVGIYVLAGDVSKTVAGPAVVISFLIAAIISLFAGLCYAEFGARVPKAGSAYIYSYYCMGEIVAFVIGWNLILEYVIGAASVARGISTYVDSLVDNYIRNFFLSFAPMDSPYLSPYVDLFAFALCITLSVSLACGVRESTVINNFLTMCNLSLVAFIIVSGLFKADIHNWHLKPSELPGSEFGEGGFAPFGLIGIIKGAAICFYGFVGFDCIATTGEEVNNPQRAIPLSILMSLVIIFLAYFGVSSVLTLMLPYFLQDPDAPIPYVYDQIGWDTAKWFISVGALFGLFSSLFGAMFPLPRIIYAMASDGLIFRILGEINSVTKTPVIGTLLAGLVTATMSAMFNLQQLISLMALGTLLAYTIVAASVVILRYSPESDDSKDVSETTGLVSGGDYLSWPKAYFLNFFSCGLSAPTKWTRKTVVLNIFLYSICSAVVAYMLVNIDFSDCFNSGSLAVVCILGTIMMFLFLSMCSQPKSPKKLLFQMPLVPLLPCISIFFNIYLMVVLDQNTWIRFAVWMAIGVVPYLSWCLWKCCHGGMGENSYYNVNRINTIKLNELIWKLVLEKKMLFEGIVNEGFVEDELFEKAASFPYSGKESIEQEMQPAQLNGSVPQCTTEDIVVLNDYEKTMECTEVNNNICREAKSESQKERDGKECELSIVEVHPQWQINPNARSDDSKSNHRDEEEEPNVEDSQQLDVQTDIQDGDTLKVNTMIYSEPEPQVDIPIPNEDFVQLSVDDDSAQLAFGPEQTPEVRRRNPLKLKSAEDSRAKDNNPEYLTSVDPSRLATERRGNEQQYQKIRRTGKLGNKELRDRLSKMLEDQALFIQAGLRPQAKEPTNDLPPREERMNDHIEIKTLTKGEIMNKLQHLLKKGPPGRPSFRSLDRTWRQDSQESATKSERTEGT